MNKYDTTKVHISYIVPHHCGRDRLEISLGDRGGRVRKMGAGVARDDRGWPGMTGDGRGWPGVAGNGWQ